jgi:hypothetical protein
MFEIEGLVVDEDFYEKLYDAQAPRLQITMRTADTKKTSLLPSLFKLRKASVQECQGDGGEGSGRDRCQGGL